jgi:tungstate transport system permease protein
VVTMADIIVQAFQKAFELIFSGDPEVWATVYRSLYVSGVGTLLACTWSIPIAVVLGLYAFRGKWAVKGLMNALIGVPTVALGLLLYLLLSHYGEFGWTGLLYTVNGIAVGEALLLTPIIVTFTGSALASADVQLRDLAKTLGASGWQTNLVIMRETIWSTTLAITAAFNRGFGELGIALIVGGNIFQQTRVLTTSIAVDLNLGAFDEAMAYGIILMAIVILVTFAVNLVERIKREEIPESRRLRDWLVVMWRYGE